MVKVTPLLKSSTAPECRADSRRNACASCRGDTAAAAGAPSSSTPKTSCGPPPLSIPGQNSSAEAICGRSSLVTQLWRERCGGGKQYGSKG
jgi:hypothetical protein